MVQLQELSAMRLKEQYKALKGNPAQAQVALSLIDILTKPAAATAE